MVVHVEGYAPAQANAKRYFELFKTACAATNKVSLMYYQGPPTPQGVCKMLGRGDPVVVCNYTARDVKNAYCAFRLECADDPDKFLSKLKDGTLLNHYYQQAVKTPDATENV